MDLQYAEIQRSCVSVQGTGTGKLYIPVAFPTFCVMMCLPNYQQPSLQSQSTHTLEEVKEEARDTREEDSRCRRVETVEHRGFSEDN